MEEQTIDLDALWNEVSAPPAPTEATPPAATDAPAPTPAGDGGAAAGGATPPAAGAPPAKADATEGEAAKPAERSAEESRLAKIENDLRLAKAAQAAVDRKNADLERRNRALEEARTLEAQHIQQLVAEGRLTQDEVSASPLRMDAWVQRREREAQQADAVVNQQRQAVETEAARAEREADIYFKEQALPLLRTRADLGLAESEIDPESLLRQTIETDPDLQADLALTWRIPDPAEQARITARIYRAATTAVADKMAALAAAKQGVAEKKAAVGTIDRSTVAGPAAAGGRAPLATFSDLSTDWAKIEWGKV